MLEKNQSEEYVYGSDGDDFGTIHHTKKAIKIKLKRFDPNMLVLNPVFSYELYSHSRGCIIRI